MLYVPASASKTGKTIRPLSTAGSGFVSGTGVSVGAGGGVGVAVGGLEVGMDVAVGVLGAPVTNSTGSPVDVGRAGLVAVGGGVSVAPLRPQPTNQIDTSVKRTMMGTILFFICSPPYHQNVG